MLCTLRNLDIETSLSQVSFHVGVNIETLDRRSQLRIEESCLIVEGFERKGSQICVSGLP